MKERPSEPSSLNVLDDLPVTVQGETMVEKIQALLTGTNYAVEMAANGDGTVMIIDKTKPMKLRGIDRVVYRSIVHFQDMRIEKGRVAIVHGYWSGSDPTEDTYVYVEKVLKLLDVPKTDKVIQGVKARYKNGKFNEHNQLTYEEKIGSYDVSYLLDTNGSYGFGIFIDK